MLRLCNISSYICGMSLLEDKTPNRTPLSKLGEFGLIQHISKNFELKNDTSTLGIGDDCAHKMVMFSLF